MKARNQHHESIALSRSGKHTLVVAGASLQVRDTTMGIEIVSFFNDLGAGFGAPPTASSSAFVFAQFLPESLVPLMESYASFVADWDKSHQGAQQGEGDLDASKMFSPGVSRRFSVIATASQQQKFAETLQAPGEHIQVSFEPAASPRVNVVRKRGLIATDSPPSARKYTPQIKE